MTGPELAPGAPADAAAVALGRRRPRRTSSQPRIPEAHAVAAAARALGDKDLATAVRRGSKALHGKLLPLVLGEALRQGEITVADGPDLPPAIRKTNKARLAKLQKRDRDALAN